MRAPKRARAGKRAGLPRPFELGREFRKDWKRLSRAGQYDLRRLKAVMLWLIANDAPLDPSSMDHALKGTWAGHRECHVGGDFLLIYSIKETSDRLGSVYFARAGTHGGLFG